MKNRKIDLKALIKAILLKWPALLAALLVFGAAGCGKYYKANHNVSSVTTNSSTENENKETATESDKDYNQSQKEAIDREIKWLDQFIDESPANSINSYKAGYAATTLYISGGNGQVYSSSLNGQIRNNDAAMNNVDLDGISTDSNTNMMMESLQTFLTSGVDWSDVKEKYDIPEDAYLYDLLNVRVSGNTMTVSFWYDTPENAESVLEDVVNQTESEFNKIKNSESLDDYSIKETASGSTTRIMTETDNWVTQRINQLKNLASSIENSNAVKTADGSVSGNSSASKPVFSKKAMLKSGIKYGAAGFILMAFLIMIWVLKKKYVLSSDEFTANTDIHEIAEINSKNRELDLENLRETLKNQYSGYKKTALVTDLNEVSKIEPLNDGKVFNRLLQDKNERESLDEYDSALVCIQENKSKYSDLSEILKVLDSRGVHVIGSAVLK